MKVTVNCLKKLEGKIIMAYSNDGIGRTSKIELVKTKEETIKISYGGKGVKPSYQNVEIESFLERINEGSILWYSNKKRAWASL